MIARCVYVTVAFGYPVRSFLEGRVTEGGVVPLSRAEPSVTLTEKEKEKTSVASSGSGCESETRTRRADRHDSTFVIA